MGACACAELPVLTAVKQRVCVVLYQQDEEQKGFGSGYCGWTLETTHHLQHQILQDTNEAKDENHPEPGRVRLC